MHWHAKKLLSSKLRTRSCPYSSPQTFRVRAHGQMCLCTACLEIVLQGFPLSQVHLFVWQTEIALLSLYPINFLHFFKILPPTVNVSWKVGKLTLKRRKRRCSSSTQCPITCARIPTPLFYLYLPSFSSSFLPLFLLPSLSLLSPLPISHTHILLMCIWGRCW